MPALMTAADALVENAGGLSCMEAFAVGLPVVTYLPIAGHGKDNAEVMSRAGVNVYVRDQTELDFVLRDVTAPGPSTRRADRPGPRTLHRRPCVGGCGVGGDQLVGRPQGPCGAVARACTAQDGVDRRSDAARALHRSHPGCPGRVGPRGRRRPPTRGRPAHRVPGRPPRRRPARGRQAHRRHEGARRHGRRRRDDGARPLGTARGAGRRRRQHRQRRVGPRHVPALDTSAQRRRPRERSDRTRGRGADQGVRAGTSARRVRPVLRGPHEAEARHAEPHLRSAGAPGHPRDGQGVPARRAGSSPRPRWSTR